MATDILLAYGGAVQFAANGDWLMVSDAPGDPAATQQRIIFALQTSPRLRDDAGNPISPPDDNGHPDYGAGLPSLIGEGFDQNLVDGITSRVTQALALDPYVANTPPPVVTVTQIDSKTIEVLVEATAITGEAIAVPAILSSATG